ncbi:hypothetical protein HMPREF7215_0060 [Pyramidobacter piscolens W5455]|uniref:Uncharacterized protein n=1 Tax=Pyramidobacter piscolens W5455 TaxID=352165 RepID=A0ABP2HTM0_9BACT|nr:hypothetical protein HMPREF7215_0060 [Pyramidobacter piscolens W5455]
MLKVYNGVVITNRRFQETFRIGGIGGGNNLQSRNMCKNPLNHLRMLCGSLADQSIRSAEDHGNSLLRSEHVMNFSHLVEHLIAADEHKIGKMHIGNGTHTRKSSPDGSTDDRRFTDRRVTDSISAEASREFLELAENASLTGDVLSHDEYGGVTLHLFDHGLLSCLRKSDGLHS